MREMVNPVKDLRFLLNRGYPRESAVNFVSNHYRLPLIKRHLLSRCVFSESEAVDHTRRRVNASHVRGKSLGVDGYNVLITTESLISGEDVIICDDGFVRDLRAIFGKYRISEKTAPALRELMKAIVKSGARRVSVLFDRQVSRSGDLASITRRLMFESGVYGDAFAVGAVDRSLRDFEVVATSDCAVIRRCMAVWDIPAEIAKTKGRVLDIRKLC